MWLFVHHLPCLGARSDSVPRSDSSTPRIHQSVFKFVWSDSEVLLRAWLWPGGPVPSRVFGDWRVEPHGSNMFRLALAHHAHHCLRSTVHPAMSNLAVSLGRSEVSLGARCWDRNGYREVPLSPWPNHVQKEQSRILISYAIADIDGYNTIW